MAEHVLIVDERLQVSLHNALAASALEGELARIKRSRAGTPLRDSAAPVPAEPEAPPVAPTAGSRCADAARRKR